MINLSNKTYPSALLLLGLMVFGQTHAQTALAEYSGSTVTQSENLPCKAPADGSGLYAWSKYPGSDVIRKGLYRLDGQDGISLVWEDDYYYEISGMTLNNGYYRQGKIVGQAVDEVQGMLFEAQRVVYDFETGEVESEHNITDDMYLDRIAYDPIDDVVYATSNETGNTIKWVKCEESDWSKYEVITTLEVGFGSLCYNTMEGAFFGIDHKGNFARLEKDGFKSIISHIDFNFQPGIIGGMVYNPKENLYYANIGSYNSSYLMTISPDGKWDVYYELPDNNQLCFMVTPEETVLDPLTPEKPMVDAVNFAAGATTGKISFTLPDKLIDGSPIKDKLIVVSLLDGVEYSRLQAEAGETVTIEYENLTPDVHYFGMYVTYDTRNSQTLLYSKYIGPDIPMTPTNVVLTDQSVSWTAVTEGIHDGYLDLNNLKYNVVVNGQEYGSTSETQMNIILPDEELQLFVAEVYAESDGMKSAPGKSKGIVAGHPFDLPMTIVPTPEQAQMVQIFDKNGDGYFWYYDSEYESFCCDYSDYGVQNDDWLVMPPFRITDNTVECSLSFLIANLNSYYPDERIEVYLGQVDKSGNIEMTDELIAPFAPEAFVADGHQEVTTEFKVHGQGTYYIGFHWISEPEQAGMEIKDIRVKSIKQNKVEHISLHPDIVMADGGFYLKNTFDGNLRIITSDGKVIMAETISNSERFYSLEPGIYIIELNDKRMKIAVK